jgi:DNA gyrase subunit B
MSKKSGYDKITVLKGLEAVRKTPGMYIGNTDDGTGYHHMLMEVLDNSVDEFMAGHCDHIIVTLHKDGSASVSDNGRGIPVHYMPEEKMTALEVVFSVLHAGGKFDESNYEHSGGLHGVGVSVVNALSARLRVVVHRDGKEYTTAFAMGKKIEDISSKNSKEKNGTFVRFIPDKTIFVKTTGFDSSKIKVKLKELSYLCKGLNIDFIDEKNKKKETFESNEGICDFVKYLAANNLVAEPIYLNGVKGKIMVDVALQWLNDGSDAERCYYYTNNIPNLDGGSHMSGFKSALTRTVNNYISNFDLPKALKVSLSGDDIREGLVAIISIRHPSPRFSSQTKDKLVSEDARTAVEGVVSGNFADYLERNPIQAKKIINRCVNAWKAREAARKARDVVKKNSLISGSGVLPGKLADCQERDPEKCEIFIVEGDSAGGSAKQGRDRKSQAILPLRGKVLNIEKCEFRKIMANEELISLITAIGGGIGKSFNPNSIRYGKIIIMSVDGDEPVCIKDNNGFSKVIRFKDAENVSETLTMDHFGNSKFSMVKGTIKYKPNIPLFKIQTYYGRSVTVTGNHSIFVDRNGSPELALASSVKKDDKIYIGLPKFSENLPERINIFEHLWNIRNDKKLCNTIIKGPDVIKIIKNRIKNNNKTLGVERVLLSKNLRKELVVERKHRNLSLDNIATKLGYKQAYSISRFERGKSNPPFNVFIKWAEYLGVSGKYKVVDSILDRLVPKNPSNRNKVKDWMKLSDFSLEEILYLGEKNIVTDKFGNGMGLSKWFYLDKDFFFSLGYWIAKGSANKTSIQWNMGKNNKSFILDIDKFANKLGIKGKYYNDRKKYGIYRISHKTFKTFFQSLVGGIKKSHNKEIPQIVFSANDSCKLAYLEGYFLGGGIIGKNNISFCTSNAFMARQLLWLLGHFDVFSSIYNIEPGEVFDRSYQNIGGKNVVILEHDIKKVRRIWHRHKDLHYLEKISFQNKCHLERFGERTYLVGVKNVEQINDLPDLVYDFSVPETERFFCGDGILCHNTDSDIDGAHIRTLLLTFFFRQMPQLIANGNLYIAVPPLYRVTVRNNSYYLKNDTELEEFIKEKRIDRDKLRLQRFKGLGEMNPQQLWDTAMDPKSRKLLQVCIDNYLEADRTFNILMGNNVEPRREFITKNALNVRHIDA